MAGEQDLYLCECGSKVLEKLFRAFTRQLHGVRHAEDPECIHQMQVSSRRLRAAMPVFQDCFPRKEFKRWLRKIRRVTPALGEARDLDVQILFLQKYQGYRDRSPETTHYSEGEEGVILPNGFSIAPGNNGADPGNKAPGIRYISNSL